MNSTQNKKIEQVKETTMIVGIDVGSEKHYFRAFNWRGIELTRKPVPFSNSMEGFNSFYNTIVELMKKSELEEALVGIEPTGHYWFDLGQFMGEKNIKFVMVNPHHVHKTKELDDNSPSKNDRKDPRVIAGLVKDGRYFYSYMPTGVYAELRNASNRRFVLVEELTRVKNRLQKWIAVYFPEYKGIYTHIDAKGGLLVLKQAPTPEEIVKLGVEGIIKIWKDAKLRGNGHKKAMQILNAAMRSIGLKIGLREARMEIQDLIEDYELQTKRLERINDLIKELCQQIKYANKLLEIKGIGITTVAGFIAEVGDITRFDNTKELQKLAGLELVADSSGKHNGKTKISKRGRKRLRYLLFEAAISVVGKNEEFKEIHRYYTTREKNPLKKMQSLIAVACKLIRVFHTFYVCSGCGKVMLQEPPVEYGENAVIGLRQIATFALTTLKEYANKSAHISFKKLEDYAIAGASVLKASKINVELLLTTDEKNLLLHDPYFAYYEDENGIGVKIAEGYSPEELMEHFCSNMSEHILHAFANKYVRESILS